jgi:hypothetical protein
MATKPKTPTKTKTPIAPTGAMGLTKGKKAALPKKPVGAARSRKA